MCLWDIRSPKSAVAKIDTEGENINITWSPDGKTLAVGNKEDVVTFIDVRGGSVSGASGDAKTEKSYILNLLRNEKMVRSNQSF